MILTKRTLEATVKNKKGTAATRRLRKLGKVPGIIYGKDTQALAITLAHDSFIHMIEKESFRKNSVITLKIDNKSEKIMIKKIQRHPFKPKILHVDFVRV